MLAKKGLFSVFLLLLSVVSFAQVTAGFTASSTEGCASSGLQVIFTNTSTGATSYSWDFGNGNTSTATNPIATYSTAGIFPVILTVTDGTTTDIFTTNVTIHNDPIANFSVIGDSTGCPGESFSFLDQSISVDGNINSWSWTFGVGGASSSSQNPTQVFNQLGFYEIKLIVTDEFGCNNQIITPNGIVIVAPPIVDFSALPTPLIACTPPLNVTFTNNSTTGLIYDWDYGVTTSSTTSFADTTVIYTTTGSYDVALTVTDPFGCAVDTLYPNYITIENVNANFLMSVDTGCPNVTTQFNASSSIGAASYSWNFGDGGNIVTNTSTTGSNLYSLPGAYNVSLSVTSASGICSNDTTITIHIENFTANASASGIYGCETPFSVTFTDLSQQNAAAWQWNFGDGQTNNTQNPVHSFQNEGFFTVQLTATSQNGCVDDTVLTDNIQVSLPQANFTVQYDSNQVCFPTVVTLTDNSSPDNTGTLSQWQWSFGNGSAAITNSSSANVTMTYNSAGDFNALLTVTSSPNNCIDTFNVIVKIGTKLNPVDSIGSDTSCAINPVEFIGVSDADSLVDTWEWFGTGGLAGNGQTYNHQYTDTSAIGWNTDTLVISYNGCYDTTFIDSVFIIGPIVEGITTSVNCNAPFDRTFSATYIDTTTYMWVFGDGDTLISYGSIGAIPFGIHGTDTTRGFYNTPSHTYAQPGNYTVELLAWNGNAFPFSIDSCAYSTSLQVNIRDTVTSFSTLQVGCAQNPITFSVTNYFPADVGAITYNWNFGDGSNIVPDNNITTNHPFSLGNTIYVVTLTFNDIHNCPFTVIDSLGIVDPVTSFSTNIDTICAGSNISFTDHSVSDTIVTSWAWNFGDGGTSNTQHPNYTFNTKGNYTVQLIATDSVGCPSTATSPVVIVEPSANFSASSTSLCAGAVNQFFDGSQNYAPAFPVVSWQWDFGNGTSSVIKNPTNSYVSAGAYTVALTVTDNLGCSNSNISVTYINVQDIPVAGFFADRTKVCFSGSQLVTLTDTTQGNIINWSWDLHETGIYTSNPNDSIVVLDYGGGVQGDTLDVSLIVETSYGCIDTTTIPNYIITLGPQATFSFTPDTVCNNDTVVFTILTAKNVTNYNWDFGDGSGSPDSVATHVYSVTQSTTLTPALFLESNESFGSCFNTEYNNFIFINYIKAQYTSTPSTGCSPLNVLFSNASIGNNLTYFWDFNEGQAASINTNPTNIFENEGTYNVILTITENMTNDSVPLGCTDTSMVQVVVFPDPIITITPSKTICLGDAQLLTASSSNAVNYQWSNGVSNSFQTIAPTVAESYSVTVTDANGCQNSATVIIDVFEISTAVLSENSVTITIGDTLTISVLDENGVLLDNALYNFVWSPATDISCNDCNEADFTGYDSTTYNISITDIDSVCARQQLSITIIVNDMFAFDLPDMFTPNDDGTNDTVFVRGYGIKKLHSFEIYNRWGERVYESKGNLKQGWDGTFKNRPQNMDTYIAVAVAENFHGEMFTIKKHITLFR